MKKEQHTNLIKKYNSDAANYDGSIVKNSDYKVPEIIKDFYSRYNITSGVILDTGCGTGWLKKVLGDNFEYWGIDISPQMIEIAQQQYTKTWIGDTLEILKSFKDKSVDHVTALSWVAFLTEKEFDELLQEFHRIARETIFVTCDQLKPDIEAVFRDTDGIQVHEHTTKIKPTEEQNLYVWKHRYLGTENYAKCYFFDLRG